MEKNNQKFLVKERKGNKEEYAIKKAPSKTWWGKAIVILIVAGTVLLPIIAMIVELFSGK